MPASLATAAPATTPIDFSRRFIPEALTPLFHVAEYANLPEAARRRYNQLYAFYFNEQVAFFEQEILGPALLGLLDRKPPAPWSKIVPEFFAEERRHTAMFRALNQRGAPELYRGQPYYFIRLSAAGLALIRVVARQRWTLPLVLWLALLQEERSLYYSKCCLETSADLEPHFRTVHRAHLADEVGHVGWDEELLDWLWPRAGRAQRAATARAFGWLVKEFFYLPKRAGREVVAQLAREFPALDAPALFHALRELQTNGTYLRTVYSRRMVPRAFARFDAHPEFALIARTLGRYPVTGVPA